MPERNGAFGGGRGNAEVKRRRAKIPTGVAFRAARSLGRIARRSPAGGKGKPAQAPSVGGLKVEIPKGTPFGAQVWGGGSPKVFSSLGNFKIPKRSVAVGQAARVGEGGADQRTDQ